MSSPARSHPLPPGRAICYSGYRDGQSPDAEVYPSEAQIAEDLRLLQPHFELLRLYDCTPHAERVLAVIERERLPLRVLLGAWLAAEVDNPGCPWGARFDPAQLDANVAANDAEVDRLIALAHAHPHTVCAVAIGNEAAVDWTDHLVPVERMRTQVRRVRAAGVRQPVTVCDNHVPWVHGDLAGLADELDFLSLHTYPLWEHKPLHESLAGTQRDVAALAERHPGKPLAITEAGWATRSNGRGMHAHAATEHAQQVYLHALLRWTDSIALPCFVFEAFDEAWKGSDDPLEPEKHWGLFRADRQPKRAMLDGIG